MLPLPGVSVSHAASAPEQSSSIPLPQVSDAAGFTFASEEKA